MAEYRKFIEKDSALDRRFQSIKVEEPSSDDAVKILMGLRANYEKHHHCIYSEEALVSAVKLSERYITSRFLPDKAIDVIDEAGARARIKMMERPQEVLAISSKIEELARKKEDAIREQRFEEAATLRDAEKSLIAQKEDVVKAWKKPWSLSAQTYRRTIFTRLCLLGQEYRFPEWSARKAKNCCLWKVICASAWSDKTRPLRQ